MLSLWLLFSSSEPKKNPDLIKHYQNIWHSREKILTGYKLCGVNVAFFPDGACGDREIIQSSRGQIPQKDVRLIPG